MATPPPRNTRPAWFVGAAWGSTDDQTERFLRQGIWENGYTDGTYFDLVKEIRPGDRIAIKSTYVRSNPNGLPFDNQGESVSTMRIKATGVVRESMGDGRRLRVDWQPVDELKEWYFYTNRGTVWRVLPVAGTWQEWHNINLINFTFYGQLQDIDAYLAIPYWGEKYGYIDESDKEEAFEELEPALLPDPAPHYDVNSIISDGCFLPSTILETILRRLQTKQNIILQGPPGTGKTWLAKRLAYALIGQKDDGKVRSFQFHPNMSYEDFVRGWRPDGKGGLVLANGPFLQLCDDARQDPVGKYVIVIEEINRGNPASTFGELLTLLEADKRNEREALALAYPDPDNPQERFHIPPNVYVIGTMNTADRSIAMIDLALRRRFAFFDLEPQLSDAWREWVQQQCGISEEFLADIAQRIVSLNDQIAGDRNLGRQFHIGHSYVTPPREATVDDYVGWFTEIVETEIAPLLYEYWFDNPSIADEAKDALLAILQ